MNNHIQHHGIKGQKWGVRRFQNKDGSLTSAGKKRYTAEDFNPKIKDTNLKSRSDSEAFKEHMNKRKNYEYTGDKEKDKFVEEAASIYEKHINSPTSKKINFLIDKYMKEGELSDDEMNEFNEAFMKKDRELWKDLEKIENDRFRVIARGGGSVHESDLEFANLGKEWLSASGENLQLFDAKTNEPGFLRYAVLGQEYVMLDSYWEPEDFW